MIEKLADYIVTRQRAAGFIDDENISVYQYGYTLMFEVIINIFISLAVGILLDKLLTVVFCLLMFIPLRSFSGGYHANKMWQCTILSNVSIGIIVCISKIYILENMILLIALEIMVVPFIVLMTPVQSENRVLCKAEIMHYKKMVKLILTVEIMIGIICALLRFYNLVNVILLLHILVVFVLILGKRSTGGRKVEHI